MTETETQPKRPRLEDDEEEEEGFFSSGVELSKRHKKSYNHILSILDDNIINQNEIQEETPDPTQLDFSDFFTSLQQELSSDPLPIPDPELENGSNSNSAVKEEGDDGDKERVIRHLLEASDDELGIPNRAADGGDGDGEVTGGGDGGFPMGLCDGLWELEDEAANYYTLLQSELFM